MGGESHGFLHAHLQPSVPRAGEASRNRLAFFEGVTQRPARARGSSSIDRGSPSRGEQSLEGTTLMEEEAAFPNDAPSGWGGTETASWWRADYTRSAFVLSRCAGSDTARLPTRSSALAEPSFSPLLSLGATRPRPSSMTLMDVSSRSGRCGKLRLEANEHVCVC